ncbi:MAG: polyprenyl synthetase family protein [Ruminococcaceae bacterium]|nr:polyprenyl synthetase family protein [Oscillospiraceae bacterium]
MMENIDTQYALSILGEDSAMVERLLDGLYTGAGKCDGQLDASARYSLMAGGKRVRPSLTLEFCRMLCGDVNRAIEFAAAVEMLHTSTLIHDDMPALDNDELRRGKPTNHKVYGEATALLAGDAMAIDAFKVLISNKSLPADTRLLAVKYLSEAAGESGVMRGQMIDKYGESHKLTLDELLTLHAHKTGALIRVAAQLGVLAAGFREDSSEMHDAVEYAERIGLAFQIVDDVLDATSTPDALGKSVGGDAALCKNTFLSFYSVDEAESYAARLTEEAVEHIRKYEGHERLVALAEFLAVRKY